MAFLGDADRSRPAGSELGARSVTAHLEPRRTTRSDRLCAGTLACRHCDAPVAIGPDPVSVVDQITCPFCHHHARVHEFLSLTAPTRPARVVVRVRVPAKPSLM